MKLVKFIFEAPLLVLCWCRGLKTNRGRAGTSTSVGLQQPHIYNNKTTTAFDRQEAGLIYEEEEEEEEEDDPVFLFRQRSKFSWLVKYFSKLLPLSLLDPRVFGQGTDSRGTDSRGTDSKNFWSRNQPTTYFEATYC